MLIPPQGAPIFLTEISASVAKGLPDAQMRPTARLKQQGREERGRLPGGQQSAPRAPGKRPRPGLSTARSFLHLLFFFFFFFFTICWNFRIQVQSHVSTTSKAALSPGRADPLLLLTELSTAPGKVQALEPMP